MTVKATAPEEVSTPMRFQQAGPDHGDVRLERVGVDDGGDGVGGVVEAVDELEAERDEQRDAEQDVGPGGGEMGAGEVAGELGAGVDPMPPSRTMPKTMRPILPGDFLSLRSSREPPTALGVNTALEASSMNHCSWLGYSKSVRRCRAFPVDGKGRVRRWCERRCGENGVARKRGKYSLKHANRGASGK